MTIPSTHTVIKLNIKGIPGSIGLVAPKDAPVSVLKLDVTRFLEGKYAITVPASSQLWSSPDDATMDSLKGTTVKIEMDQSADENLAMARVQEAAKWQKESAEQILKGFGLEEKTVTEWAEQFTELFVARRGLPLPEELATLCVERVLGLTPKQKSALEFASTVRVQEYTSACSFTGISSHDQLVLSFTAIGCAWVWRVDSGSFDGEDYFNAELYRLNAPVLQVSRGRFQLPKSWRPDVAPEGFKALEPDEVLHCLLGLLPEDAPRSPLELQYSWSEREEKDDRGPQKYDKDPIWDRPIIANLSHNIFSATHITAK